MKMSIKPVLILILNNSWGILSLWLSSKVNVYEVVLIDLIL